MQRVFRAILFSTGFPLTHACFAAPGPVTVPPSSFLNQPVASVAQLSRQVASDPVVRRRLARHFHISSPFLLHYIQQNLVLKTLPADFPCSVYKIAPDGHSYVISTLLPTGTHVFAFRETGQPALKFSSGNPLVASLPGLSGKTALTPPKPFSVIRVAQIISLAHAKTPAAKAKSEPLFFTVNGDMGLYIMPQKAASETISDHHNPMLGQRGFWK